MFSIVSHALCSVGLEELSQNYRSLEQKNRERLARELEASRSKADALHKELKQDIEADVCFGVVGRECFTWKRVQNAHILIRHTAAQIAYQAAVARHS